MPVKSTPYKLIQSGMLILLGLLLASPVYAVQVPTAQEMLTNLANQVPQIMRMVTAAAYVIGFFFVVKGLLLLKQFGDMRTMMSQQHSLKGPLLFLLIGSLLIYLPSTVSVGMATFWDNPSPLAYVPSGSQTDQFYKVIFTVIELVGTIAFIRGLILLSSLGNGGQPGVFGRGMTHIVGGIFCINIYEFIRIVLATLGVTGVPGFS